MNDTVNEVLKKREEFSRQSNSSEIESRSERVDGH